MLTGTRRRLERLEGQVAGLGSGCLACRLLGDVLLIDDHGHRGLPDECPRCGRSVAAEATIHLHVVDAHMPVLLGLKGARHDATARD